MNTTYSLLHDLVKVQGNIVKSMVNWTEIVLVPK